MTMSNCRYYGDISLSILTFLEAFLAILDKEPVLPPVALMTAAWFNLPHEDGGYPLDMAPSVGNSMEVKVVIQQFISIPYCYEKDNLKYQLIVYDLCILFSRILQEAMLIQLRCYLLVQLTKIRNSPHPSLHRQYP